ncbi:hypothetical protein DV451_002271 [Geotrichum candidum]|uniref:Mediator of RNA polymerase II transcription subunit 1 n=1 Tax=Geotrichum candidum TaxID=1173061 RepID=A0A9P5G6K6_GEOCN|nr:hypothetical protein DV451_002271 [Geotrichum candidum]KAF5106768.1 hypothetical protein DV453_003655 [Geotrichum candidum]
MDTQSKKITNVSLSLASQEPSNPQYSFSSPSVFPLANTILLHSLTERKRLDRFANILGFLACADKLSTSVDCFRAIDEVAAALFRVYNASESAHSDITTSWYGIPELNPCGTLGLGLWYWQKKRHTAKIAGKHFSQTPDENNEDDQNEQSNELDEEFQKYMLRWSIRGQQQHKDNNPRQQQQNNYQQPQQGRSAKYAVRYSANWLGPMLTINPNTGLVESWNEPEFVPDQKAEFVLLLDPPVYLPYTVAATLNATTDNSQSESKYYLNQIFRSSQRIVLHPNGKETKFEVSFSSLVPNPFVKVTEIPISHPRDLPEVIKQLRKAILIDSLCQSMSLDKKTADPQPDNDEDNGEDDEALDSELLLIDALLEGDFSTNSGHGKLVGSKESTATVITRNENGENITQSTLLTNISLIEENDEIFILVNLPGLNDFSFRVSPHIQDGDGGKFMGLLVGHVGFDSRKSADGKSSLNDIDIQTIQTKLSSALELTEDLGIACAYIERSLSEHNQNL